MEYWVRVYRIKGKAGQDIVESSIVAVGEGTYGTAYFVSELKELYGYRPTAQ